MPTLCGAALAAPGPKVTLRVEGKARTLLAPKLVQTRSGWITKNGAPSGACSASSAAGALDAGSRHRWAGKFESSFGDFFVTSILGDAESGKSFYWGLWVDDRFASAGICGTKLRGGDRVLFAVDSVAHHEHPLELTGPDTVHAGATFTVKVRWFSDAGVGVPAAGARIAGAGRAVSTDTQGLARINARAGRGLLLQAGGAGYVRSAPLRVRVSG